MRFTKVNLRLIAFAVCVLLVGVPQFSYAWEYYEDTSDDYEYGYDEYEYDDYEYVDENGELMDDDYVTEEEVDTSWFDSDNPKKEYHIKTKAQLLGFASLVNEKQSIWKENVHEHFKGVTFYLEADIKLKSPWKPVGDDEQVCFEGIFDGKGHTISGLEIDSKDTKDTRVGFFGYLPGKVRDLNLKGSAVSYTGPCGAFAGCLTDTGRITNCTADVDVKGKSKTGGIAGFNDGGRIYGAINYGNVSGTRNVGGIAGENRGTLRECINYGNMKSSRRGTGTFGTGGVAGRTVGGKMLESCSNAGNITSRNEATGGVAGFATTAGTCISGSFSSGNIKVINTKADKRGGFRSYAGGVIGITASEGVIIDHCNGYGQIKGADVIGQVTGGNLNETGIEAVESVRQLSRWQQHFGYSLKAPDMAKARAMLPMYEKLYKFEKKCSEETRKGYVVMKVLTPTIVRTQESIPRNGFEEIIEAGAAGQHTENLNEDGNKDTESKKQYSSWQQYFEDSMKTPDMAEAKAMLPKYKNMYRFEKKCDVKSRKGYVVLKSLTPTIVRTQNITPLSEVKLKTLR